MMQNIDESNADHFIQLWSNFAAVYKFNEILLIPMERYVLDHINEPKINCIKFMIYHLNIFTGTFSYTLCEKIRSILLSMIDLGFADTASVLFDQYMDFCDNNNIQWRECFKPQDVSILFDYCVSATGDSQVKYCQILKQIMQAMESNQSYAQSIITRFKSLNIQPTSETFKKHWTLNKSVYNYSGLCNYGSTCSINATLQLLFTVDEFRNIIINGNFELGSTGFVLQTIFNQMQNSKAQYVGCTMLIDLMKINIHEARDASLILYDILSNVNHNFRLVSKQYITSLEEKCEHDREPTEHETFYLSLSIDNDGIGSVAQAIDLEYAPVFLSGCNGLHCDKCDTKVNFIKTSKLISNNCSNYMICTLKRFSYQDNVKITKPILCNKFLDLTKYCDNTTKYELTGILISTGDTTNSGHFFYLTHQNHQWYSLNDETVQKWPINTNNLNMMQKYAYILVYKKIIWSNSDRVNGVRSNSDRLNSEEKENIWITNKSRIKNAELIRYAGQNCILEIMVPILRKLNDSSFYYHLMFNISCINQQYLTEFYNIFQDKYTQDDKLSQLMNNNELLIWFKNFFFYSSNAEIINSMYKIFTTLFDNCQSPKTKNQVASIVDQSMFYIVLCSL